jgi:hypothetical protein
MPAFSTTLLGVIRGVADCYGMTHSDAMLYGLSGHAFLMNIEPTLCPSGPYCWNGEGFARQLRCLGIAMTPFGFLGAESGGAKRGEAERWVREHMDAGVPCSLLNMEHQLITGIDAEGIQTAQPWPKMDFPPARLTFGTWAELGKEIHVTFFAWPKCEPAALPEAVRDSLRFALDLCDNPGAHQELGYSVGAGAYAAWISAVSSGHGTSHGAWWNAMVWSECRDRAGDYFDEISRWHPGLVPQAAVLAGHYHAIAASLREAGQKETPDGRRLALLAGARDREAECIHLIREAHL